MQKLLLIVVAVFSSMTAFCMQLSPEQALMQCMDKEFFLRVNQEKIVRLFEKQEKLHDIIADATSRLLVKEIQANHKTSVTLQTERGAKVTVEFFENGSPFVVVVGLGAWEGATDIHRFVKILSPDFDVITIQYEWHNWSKIKNAWYSLFHCDGFFEHSFEEIEAIVHYVREHAQYREIVGLGVCYSALMMAWAQAHSSSQGNPLFTKLILDSVPYSVRTYFEAMMQDPSLGQSPEGSSPGCFQCVFNSCPFSTMRSLFLDLYVSDFNVDQWLAQITDVPILFIRGINDHQVIPENFEKLWNATQIPKAAFITPYHHANNFKWEGRAVYRHVVHNFINKSFGGFVQSLVTL